MSQLNDELELDRDQERDHVESILIQLIELLFYSIEFVQVLPKDLKSINQTNSLEFNVNHFLVELPSVVDATDAATSLGTFSIRKFNNLRVSFSLILKNV